MPSVEEKLRRLERRRLRALVKADEQALDSMHAPDFVLINPSGGAWSRAHYLGGVVSGEINYRRFDALSEVEAMVDGNLAVLRYQSAIDIHVEGQEGGSLEAWHLNCYRRASAHEPWLVAWAHATAIDTD